MAWQAGCSIIIGKRESRGRIIRMITFLIQFRVLRRGKIWGGETRKIYRARARLFKSN